MAVPHALKVLKGALCLGLICGVGWLLVPLIATGDIRGMILVGVTVMLLGVAGRIIGNWRSGVYLFLIWLLFEDLVRKYMGNNMAIYFAKDILAGTTYFAFLMARLRGDFRTFRLPFRFGLGLFGLLAVAQVFNVNSPSLFYGLLGLKLYFYYVPLVFVGYVLIQTEHDLRRFLVVNMGVAGVIALVAIVQSIVGLDFLNPRTGADLDPLGHLTRYTSSGVAVTRPPSVFVSDGRLASYLVLAFILGVGAAGYLLLRANCGRTIVFSALALVGVAVTVSGSRSCVMFVVFSALILATGLLWGAPPRSGDTYRLFKAISRTFVFMAVGLALAAATVPKQISARWTFYQETLSPDSPQFELGARLGSYPVSNFLAAFSDPEWIIGHGIGTASLGGQYVTRILGVPATGVAVESGYGVLILEFGILGLALWLLWTFGFIVAAFKLIVRLKGTWAFPVALSISWFAFLLLFPYTFVGMQAYQNFVLNAYLWLLLGILFRLPSLLAHDEACQQVRSAHAP